MLALHYYCSEHPGLVVLLHLWRNVIFDTRRIGLDLEYKSTGLEFDREQGTLLGCRSKWIQDDVSSRDPGRIIVKGPPILLHAVCILMPDLAISEIGLKNSISSPRLPPSVIYPLNQTLLYYAFKSGISSKDLFHYFAVEQQRSFL
jgi:hypothetical protein